MIFQDIAATVGKTPLVELRRIGKGLPARIAVKLESRNPCGSVNSQTATVNVSASAKPTSRR